MDREELEAHLKVLDLEDELKAKKEYGDDDGTPAWRDLKGRLREARRVHRTIREGGEPAEGVARPATVETGAEVHGWPSPPPARPRRSPCAGVERRVGTSSQVPASLSRSACAK